MTRPALTAETLAEMRARCAALCEAEAVYLALGPQKDPFQTGRDKRAAMERIADVENILQSHAAEDIPALLDWIEAAVPLLREGEWTPSHDGPGCWNGCNNEEREGHEPGCKRAARFAALLAGFPHP